MALAAHLGLTTLFGTNAVISGSGNTATLTVRLTDLSADIDTASPEDLSPEGIYLAILQKGNNVQGADAARVLSLSRSPATITTRGNVTCRAEKYTITVYSTSGTDILDPDLV